MAHDNPEKHLLPPLGAEETGAQKGQLTATPVGVTQA